MTALPKHPVAVAAAVVGDGGRLLALRRPEDGRWEPPGGMLEEGEMLSDGLRREVFEETGLEVEVLDLEAVYQNVRTGTVVLTFRCVPEGGSLTPNSEASGLRWMTPDEVAAEMPEIFSRRVLDTIAGGGPAIRVHDGRTFVA